MINSYCDYLASSERLYEAQTCEEERKRRNQPWHYLEYNNCGRDYRVRYRDDPSEKVTDRMKNRSTGDRDNQSGLIRQPHTVATVIRGELHEKRFFTGLFGMDSWERRIVYSRLCVEAQSSHNSK